MKTVKVPVNAYILGLYPKGSPQPASVPGLRLISLSNGLALPSFWSRAEINEAFDGANRIWSKADIEFGPIQISDLELSVKDDENGMWIDFVNKLSPKHGISVGFVYDLPSNEGGWGGGRIAIIAGKKTMGAIAGYSGRILAHEIGHILLGDRHREDDPSNLMYGNRHPRVVSADLLDSDQIRLSQAAALAL
jgi:hypothetical protein